MSEKGTIAVLIGGLLLGATAGVGGTLAWKDKTQKPQNLSNSCSIGDSGSASQSDLQSAVIFELNGKTYSSQNLPTNTAKEALFQVQQMAYENTSNVAKELALRIHLAAEQNKPTDEKLPQINELMPLEKPSEQEVAAFFESNKQALPPGAKLADFKVQIEQFLNQQKNSQLVRKKSEELVTSGKLKILLPRPTPPTVKLEWEGFPVKGDAKAKVTIVEVSDYMCPHCRHSQPEITQFLQEAGDKVKFIQVNFSLNPNGLSGTLVRGAYCAQKQSTDLFWKYHESAFQIERKEQDNDENKYPLEIAKKVGVNIESFSSCLGSDEAKNYVTKTNADMVAAGISGTPTFFVNNQRLVVEQGKSLSQALNEALKN